MNNNSSHLLSNVASTCTFVLEPVFHSSTMRFQYKYKNIPYHCEGKIFNFNVIIFYDGIIDYDIARTRFLNDYTLASNSSIFKYAPIRLTPCVRFTYSGKNYTVIMPIDVINQCHKINGSAQFFLPKIIVRDCTSISYSSHVSINIEIDLTNMFPKTSNGTILV